MTLDIEYFRNEYGIKVKVIIAIQRHRIEDVEYNFLQQFHNHN